MDKQNFIKAIKNRLKDIEDQLKELQSYEKEKNGLQNLLMQYEPLGEQKQERSDINFELAAKIKIDRAAGATQLDCIKTIARAKPDRIVRLIELKKLFLTAEIMKDTKSIMGNIYSVVSRCEDFEKIDRGMWKLKEEHEPIQLHLP